LFEGVALLWQASITVSLFVMGEGATAVMLTAGELDAILRQIEGL
jgi:hypothetical protein